jgi:hypothetical protein
MEFENAGLSRDFLYLFCFFAGTALGALLSVFKRGNTLRAGSAWISAALVLFSAAVAFAAAAVIFSGGAVFLAFPLYVPAAVILVLGVFGIRFPRAGACTVIFMGGLFAVWVGLSFLRYPSPGDKEPEGISVFSSGDGTLVLRRGGRDGESWNIKDGGPLKFEAAAIDADFRYPLIGGEKRGLITRVDYGSQNVFLSPKSLSAPDQGRLGFSHSRFSLTLPAGVLLSGMGLSILFDGEDLYFDPPIQLPQFP